MHSVRFKIIYLLSLSILTTIKKNALTYHLRPNESTLFSDDFFPREKRGRSTFVRDIPLRRSALFLSRTRGLSVLICRD